jgi:hypothetical protein
LVLKLDKNLVYSFTNNYFTEITEKGDTLDYNELEKNFEYALDDLKRKKTQAKKNSFNSAISNIINDSKNKAFSLT